LSNIDSNLILRIKKKHYCRCYAKYLWKRIPLNIKNSCSDVRSIWTVAQKMWQRDWPAVHIALNVEWNKNVAEIMNALKGKLFFILDGYLSLEKI
jgi:hypothetical protein